VTSTYLPTSTSTTASLTIQNSNPVANPDLQTVNENAASAPIDVLANDTDVDGDTRTVTSVTDPPHGTASVQSAGVGVLYQPDHNYSGTDSFTYTISDGHGGTATGTVTVTVTATGLTSRSSFRAAARWRSTSWPTTSTPITTRSRLPA
jgi:hypothetical protein